MIVKELSYREKLYRSHLVDYVCSIHQCSNTGVSLAKYRDFFGGIKSTKIAQMYHYRHFKETICTHIKRIFGNDVDVILVKKRNGEEITYLSIWNGEKRTKMYYNETIMKPNLKISNGKFLKKSYQEMDFFDSSSEVIYTVEEFLSECSRTIVFVDQGKITFI